LKLLGEYDVPPWVPPTAAGGLPFVDVAGRLVTAGPVMSPGLLRGLSAQQVAADLSDPANPVSRAILGEANYLTAGMCAATGDHPANVCLAPEVRQAALAAGLG
jgi:hypothetical protein